MKYSFIIPVYNDKEGISITLNSLARLQYPSDNFEIIVVDNNSTDGTFEFIQKYQSTLRNIIVSREIEKKGSYAARNKGINVAKGEYIIFFDADMWLDDSFLKLLDSHIDSLLYAGCDIEIVSQSNGFWELYNVITGFPVESYLANQHFVPTACLIVKKDIIKKVGQFSETLVSGGDEEFGKRVHQAGYNQTFLKGITVYHPARKTFSSLKKKYIRIGRGIAQKMKSGDYQKSISWLIMPLNPINPMTFLKTTQGANIPWYYRIAHIFAHHYFMRICIPYGIVYEKYLNNENSMYR